MSAGYFGGFLLPLFHKGLGEQQPSFDDPETAALIGQTPYVNGGIFEQHPLERAHEISVPEVAFEELFDFFGQWRWHLDERPSGDPREINPDVLGFIFEQHVNQRQQGAYYTKPDVTEFMTTSVVVPAVIDRLVAAGLEDPCVLLPRSGDDYLHGSLGYGREHDLPDETPPSEYPNEALDLALPGERWCDVLHRRAHYEEMRAMVDDGQVTDVDDAVTQNLNLRVLIDDYLRTLANPDEVQTALNVLRSLTICDPTVGSGAFLFAALDVLDDMYTALLERAEELESKSRGSAPFLAEARDHSSPRYWLLKTICLHNLYGVDLVAEAGEIAKLRLFLKLAAQLDDAEQMEPLPDLDFNIKAGNLLVGIADREDAERRFGSGRVPYDHLRAITEEADQIAGVYGNFVSAQTHSGDAVGTDAKANLLERFESARAVADSELFRLRGEVGELEEWQRSHRPFHWFVEFPSVWRNGGFDAIVGNPPYIKASDVRKEYRWLGYAADTCPNLYAICTERAAGLTNERGRMAFVVMHSICFSRAFEPLRNHLEGRFGALWVSSYARIPDGLFTGSARVRNSIVVASRPSDAGLRLSRCRRWTVDLRPNIFATLKYIEPRGLLIAGPSHQWPFIDEAGVVDSLLQLVAEGVQLSGSRSRDRGYTLKFKQVAQYELGIYVDEPPAYDSSGRQIPLPQIGEMRFADSPLRDIAFVVLSSVWAYLWWTIYGDEFHVTPGVLASFPLDPRTLADGSAGQDLLRLAHKLRDELPRHLKFKQNAGVRVGRYDLRECRHITDEIDRALARAWRLSDENLEAAWNLRDRINFGQTN